jgi:ABC-type nitrate/sulfonate/bicarbonate transport system substrate-binding protein
MHVEKVFLVPQAFHNEDPESHYALLRALYKAACYCDDPQNREHLAEVLSKEAYVGVPVKALSNALVGPFTMGKDRYVPAEDAIVFHRNDANRPTKAKARWVLDEIGLHQLQPAATDFLLEDIGKCFREDIYKAVLDTETVPTNN